jgi:hypothetical protein
MLLYGLADYTVNEILEWYPTRQDAEDAGPSSARGRAGLRGHRRRGDGRAGNHAQLAAR